MGAGNGAHRLRRWRIIEKNAAAAIDLQVDETGRQHRSRRHDLGWPSARTLIPRQDALDHPAIDHEDRIIVPSLSVENTVSRNGPLRPSDVVGGLQTHRLASSLAVVSSCTDC